MVRLHLEHDEGKYNERLLFAHYIVCGLSFYNILCRNIIHYLLVCKMSDMLFRSECNRFESQLQPGTQHST